MLIKGHASTVTTAIIIVTHHLLGRLPKLSLFSVESLVGSM